MKNLKMFWIFILVVTSIWNAKAQTNFKCFVTTSTVIPTPSPSNSCGNFLSNFLLKPSDPIDTIDLNFIFFKPGSPGIYIPSVITPAIIQTIVNGINIQWANLDPPHLPISPPAAVLTDSKIRFRLKNLSLVTDSMAYIYNPSFSNLTPYRDTTAIDIFWCFDTSTLTSCGGGGVGGGGIVRMGFCGNQTPAGIDALLGHELGHALGLNHPFDGSNLLHGAPAYSPLVSDLNYPKEIALKDSARSCFPIYDSSSNNILSYNWKCRSYLSPEQVAGMRYLLRSTGPTNGFLKPNQNICNVNHAKDSTYTSNQFWNTIKFIDGDVIIDSAVKITVNCQVWMRPNSKVIVKPGGKLIINKNGSFQSTCINFWKGIEIWGNPYQGQYIDNLTGMPMYQGMVEMFGGKISDALVGVTLGKRDSLGNPVLGSGGGIIQAKDTSTFNHNKICVEFFPYSFVSRNPLYSQNQSSFKTTSFTATNGSYYGNFISSVGVTPYAFVVTDGVQAIKFFGCSFYSDYVGGVPYGIKGVNSSIDMRDYCTAASSSVCTGTLIRNTFNTISSATGCQYGVYLSNYSSYMPSLIDHVSFNKEIKGGIYMANVNQTQISNCTFTVQPSSIAPKYGIYLDNCTGYRVENNSFTAVGSGLKNVGIYVNNSGPYANSIYNNTFNKLEQGLWAQNQNVDWTTQIGLKMNCNDFTNCKYDIGVQKGGRYAASLPNNTGVDFTQGVANTLNEPDNVRNTYNVVSCYTNAENKFYINSLNTFYTNHGSFLGPQFHPTPHTNNSCSDSLELIDIIGTPPLIPIKLTYCPSVFTPTFSNLMLNSGATTQRQSITSCTSSLASLVDGGNTQGLLSAINSGTISDGTLKNILVSKGPYLSDEVMIAFYNTNPPYGHDKIIHEINAPVSPQVYRKILTLNLPSGVLESIQTNQNQNGLSARRLLEAKLNLARTELGLILNEKIRRFVGDSILNPVDSLIQIYSRNEIANSEQNLVMLYISAGRFEEATNLLVDLSNRINASTDFIELQSIIISVLEKPDLAKEAISSPELKTKLLNWAMSGDNLIEGQAKSLLAFINEPIEEEKLSPDEGSGARFSNQTKESETTIVQLNNSVKIYPNPANNVLFVEMENNNASTIEIRDVTGKLLISQNIDYKGTINIQNLQNGVYFVNLVNGNELMGSKKIVIIK